jgi:hypothetical protein
VRAPVVALAGPSGSGKSTAVALLARRRGWVPLDEAYYRLRPRPALAIPTQRAIVRLELRLLEEESRRFRAARELSEGGRTVVADTPFLDPVEYTAGLRALGLASLTTLRAVARRARALASADALGVPDVTVHLLATASARRARVERDPLGHPRAFRDRHEAVGRAATNVLLPWLRRRYPRSVRVVRASATPPVVADRVRAVVARAVALSDPCRDAVRRIDGLLRLPELRGPDAQRQG